METLTFRRSPRLVAAGGKQTNDDGTSAHTENSHDVQHALSSWNETSFDPYASSSSPVESTSRDSPVDNSKKRSFSRLSSRLSSHGNDDRHSRNNAPLASIDRNAIASRTRSTDSARSRSIDTRKVSFGRETRSNKRGHVAAAQKSQPLVTPASRDNTANSTSATTTGTYEQQASLALAALCKQSDQRNGRKAQPVTDYIGKMAALPLKKKDVAFPAAVHAMVTELNASAPDVLQWVNDGGAFIIHQPKSPILVEALKKYFKHSKCSSLQRQLNIYGWIKIKRGELKGAFYNPHFHRDRNTIEDFSLIQRRHSRKRSTHTRTDPLPAVAMQVPTRLNARNRTERQGEHDIPGSEAMRTNPSVQAPLSMPSKTQTTKTSVYPVSRKSSKDTLVAVMNGGRVVSATVTIEGVAYNPSTEHLDSFLVHSSTADSEYKQDALVSSHDTGQEGTNLSVQEPIVDMSGSPCFAASVTSAESPFDLDGIRFDPLSLPIEEEEERKLPFLVDDRKSVARCLVLHDTGVDQSHAKNPPAPPEEMERSPQRVRITLYDGKSLDTSPLDASAAYTFESMAADMKGVVGNQQEQQRLPSPVERETVPEHRVPPPCCDTSVESVLTPISLKHCSSPADFTPFALFSSMLSSALGLREDCETQRSASIHGDGYEEELLVARGDFDKTLSGAFE